MRVLVVIESLFYLLKCIRPVSGLHAFRQAQTNWPAVWWTSHGFSPFNPVIPIKGVTHSTWLLEFPLFQWITYLGHLMSGVRIDYLARILALACAIGSVHIVAKILANRISLNYWIVVAIFITNPYFAYWATTGLVDWLALLLGYIGAYLLNKNLSDKQQKNRYLGVISIAATIISFTIKPTHALFSILFTFIVNPIKVKRTDYLKIARITSIVIPGLIAEYTWSSYTSKLYSASDPRSIWATTRKNFSWFFGSQNQYFHVVENVKYVLLRYINSSYGLLTVSLALILIAIAKKYLRTNLLLLVLGFCYVGVLVNLNLVHEYYQIPLIFIAGSIFAFSVDSLFSHSIFGDIKVDISVILSGLLVASLATSHSGAKNYFDMLFLKNNSASICPKYLSISSPVLVLKTEDPQYLYECKIIAFESQFDSKNDINSFLAERKRYFYLYYEGNLEDKEFLHLKSILRIREVTLKEKNWYGVTFN